MTVRTSTITLIVAHHARHKADVIVLGQFSIFLQIRALVAGHAFHQVFDQLVRYQRVSEVHLGDVRLIYISKDQVYKSS